MISSIGIGQFQFCMLYIFSMDELFDLLLERNFDIDWQYEELVLEPLSKTFHGQQPDLWKLLEMSFKTLTEYIKKMTRNRARCDQLRYD